MKKLLKVTAFLTLLAAVSAQGMEITIKKENNSRVQVVQTVEQLAFNLLDFPDEILLMIMEYLVAVNESKTMSLNEVDSSFGKNTIRIELTPLQKAAQNIINMSRVNQQLFQLSKDETLTAYFITELAKRYCQNNMLKVIKVLGPTFGVGRWLYNVL